jgi:hypothetical protein
VVTDTPVFSAVLHTVMGRGVGRLTSTTTWFG